MREEVKHIFSKSLCSAPSICFPEKIHRGAFFCVSATLLLEKIVALLVYKSSFGARGSCFGFWGFALLPSSNFATASRFFASGKN